jgi:hypothetical protein
MVLMLPATGPRRQLNRRYVLAFFQKLPPCLIGIEGCASSHHWSRELQALGHTVRLMPAAYVKPYVKRQKNDAADAETICEAVTRTKKREQQSCLMLHRTRYLFIRQQTAVINASCPSCSLTAYFICLQAAFAIAINSGWRGSNAGSMKRDLKAISKLCRERSLTGIPFRTRGVVMELTMPFLGSYPEPAGLGRF